MRGKAQRDGRPLDASTRRSYFRHLWIWLYVKIIREILQFATQFSDERHDVALGRHLRYSRRIAKLNSRL